MGRLGELDGLRAVAIIMVISFHYFARFPEFYPYPASTFPVVVHGFMGVNLFFLISGFVIAMTLSSSTSVMQFVVRRFTRLWPPILICSLVTFATLHLIDNPFTLARRTGWDAFLPSLTFTSPSLWTWLLPDAGYVDGAYWSLFVEVRFYAWIAAIYFLTGARQVSATFVAFTAVTWTACQLLLWTGHMGLAKIGEMLFFSSYSPLFCAGVLFYEQSAGAGKRWTNGAIALCLLAALITSEDVISGVMTTLFFALFVMLLHRRAWMKPFANPMLRWIGLTSYSTYLLHQNIGVAIITEWFDRSLPVPILYGGAVAVAALMVAMASILYFLVERHAGALGRILLQRVPQGRFRQGLT